MDEFDVLTERFGLKPQGKAAPMAAFKESKLPTSSSNFHGRNLGFDSGFNPNPSAYSSRSSSLSNTGTQNYGGFDDYGDLLFREPNKSTKQSDTSFDYDSIFSNNSSGIPSSLPIYNGDDIFGGMPGLKSSVSTNNDDVFTSFDSPPKQSASIDDLLGNFGGGEARSKSRNQDGSVKNESDFSDLIPGFGGSSIPSSGTSQPQQSSVHSTKSTFISSEDPFTLLETISNTSSELFSDPLEQLSRPNKTEGTKLGAIPILRPPPKPVQVLNAQKVKSSHASSIDELEDFAMSRVGNKASKQSDVRTSEKFVKMSHTKSSLHNEAEYASSHTMQQGGDDLESFFSVGSRSNSVPRSRATTLDTLFDAPVHKRSPEVPQRMPSEASASMKKSSSAPFMVDDFSSIFGAAPSFGEFQEVVGESEERRRARLGRHQRTQDRAAQAVADMNQRDLQTQWEQEERRRISETVDIQIKRWAAGKEGNMRALLSSLESVLWPECDWQPVSLTDMITSASVKKVYRKATLFIHPDKVQQKGATLEQKYTAEKVFDILKEAWKKFNVEELS